MPNEMNNYIEDDWNDNKLEDRDSAEKGIYYNYSEGGTGNLLKGVYRPLWKVVNGNPTGENGKLDFPKDRNKSEVKIPSTLVSGSWSYNFTYVSGSNNPKLNVFIIEDLNRSDYWYIKSTISGADQLDLNKNGTKVIDGAWGRSYGTQYSVEVTRDSYGNWELFEGGTSEGTTTDTFLPSQAESISINNRDGRGHHTIDNLKAR